MEKQKIYELLTNEIKQGIVKIDESMKKHTNFKIGGNADVFVIAKSIEEIKCVIKFSKENNIPLAILGNGSNVLVLDKGIQGLVLKIDIKGIDIENPEIENFRKVYQYTLEGDLVKVWDSINECKKTFPSALQVCLGKRNHCKKFKFSFDKLKI